MLQGATAGLTKDLAIQRRAFAGPTWSFATPRRAFADLRRNSLNSKELWRNNEEFCHTAHRNIYVQIVCTFSAKRKDHLQMPTSHWRHYAS